MPDIARVSTCCVIQSWNKAKTFQEHEPTIADSDSSDTDTAKLKRDASRYPRVPHVGTLILPGYFGPHVQTATDLVLKLCQLYL